MKQIFHRYEKWEDYKNGLFRTKVLEKNTVVAYNLLKNQSELKKYMTLVVREWKNSAETNLTNPSINYQAWLGQAACCKYGGCSDLETKNAWWKLKEKERIKANNVADEIYKKWVETYEKTTGFYQLNIFDKEVYYVK